MTKDVFDSAKDVFYRHLPTTREPLDAGFPHCDDYAALYILATMAGVGPGRARVRVKDPDNTWENILRQAETLQKSLESISPLEERKAIIRALEDTITKAKRRVAEERTFIFVRTKVSIHTALFVVYARGIWALEAEGWCPEQRRDFGRCEKLSKAMLDADAFLLQVGADPTSPAPFFEKFDAPGPFGRFLEDMMVALHIQGKRGQRLSAASALRASKNFLSTLEREIPRSC